jgi:hypothetical protein
MLISPCPENIVGMECLKVLFSEKACFLSPKVYELRCSEPELKNLAVQA